MAGPPSSHWYMRARVVATATSSSDSRAGANGLRYSHSLPHVIPTR